MERESGQSKQHELSRRGFLRTASAAALTAAGTVSAGGIILPPGLAAAEEAKKKAKKPAAESFVKKLYETLTPAQKKVMHFPWEHKLRTKVANNWHIVDQKVGAVGTLYNKDQQELIRLILKGITTEDGYERITKAMKDDDGGLGRYACAIFGDPEKGEKFEFVLTGRHLTLRADGDTTENSIFGGPIFYGHAVEFEEKPDHPGNVYWHQARVANKVFQALDGKQQEMARVRTSPGDRAASVRLQGSKGEFTGIAGSELSADQKGLLKKSLQSLMSMFRESDVKEVMDSIEKNGGLDKLHMSFYQAGDIGNDGVWDRWKVEGPAFSWYFRGSPHVHTWLNVQNYAGKDKPQPKSKAVRV